MRVPHTVPATAFEAYECSEETLLLPGEQGRRLRAQDKNWDESIPADLRSQALRVIAANWRDKPIIDELPTSFDHDELLENLPLDLPFTTCIAAIPDEHYWQRAAQARWKFSDPSAHGDSWLRLYCERHVAEYLENFHPASFNGQRDECEALLKLVREHVRALELQQLMPYRSKPRPIPDIGDEEDEDKTTDAQSETQSPPGTVPDVRVIPLDVVFRQLPLLRRFSLNVGVVQKGSAAEWQDFQLAVQDAQKLGRGLKYLRHLAKFSIKRSYLDQPRAAAIFQGLAANHRIQEIDLSHCKLGDETGHAIGAFLSLRQPRVLRLVNCSIGPDGLGGIVLGILKEEQNPSGEYLRHLDLRLNPLGDDGAVHIAAMLLRFAHLKYLNISACSIRPDGGMGIAEVLNSGRTNFSYLELDCSNNDLGTIVGEAFEIVAKSCIAIVGIDVRMCSFKKESEYSIIESVSRNRERAQKDGVEKEEEDDDEEEEDKEPGTTRVKGRKPNPIQKIVPPPEYASFQRPLDRPPSVQSSEHDFDDEASYSENEEDEDEEEAAGSNASDASAV